MNVTLLEIGEQKYFKIFHELSTKVHFCWTQKRIHHNKYNLKSIEVYGDTDKLNLNLLKIRFTYLFVL